MYKPVSQDARPPERISLIMGSHGVRIWTADASLAHRYPDDVVYEYVPASDESLIRSRVLEEAAGEGWLPIETAPKDGTSILLAVEFDGPGDWRIKVGGWSLAERSWTIFGASWKPTHWRPLPAPPSSIRKLSDPIVDEEKQ